MVKTILESNSVDNSDSNHSRANQLLEKTAVIKIRAIKKKNINSNDLITEIR